MAAHKGLDYGFRDLLIYLFTDEAADFYRKLGFKEQGIGLGKVVGQWLVNES